jgi:tripartite-type tricarboxylate transporter receptor subunit TctC
MQNLTLSRRSVLAAAAAGALPTALFAQEQWPTRPVKIIVPSSPGGGTDVFGRILAQALSEQTKQSFIVDNKPGASGNIGADLVAKSEPDGYTMLVASNSSLGINPVLLKQMPFDIEKDLVPITRAVFAPMVIVANPATGWKNLKDLVEAGKKEPGKFVYGTAGVGSPLYMGVRMLEEVSGAKFLHVPYKGAGPAYQDLLANRVNFMLTDLASIEQHIKAGKLVPLAVTQKVKVLPNVPTVAEAGYPQWRAWTSFSVMAPAKVSPAIVRRMHEEISKALHNPQVIARLDQQVLIPVYDTQQEFAADLRKEREHWGAFIKRNNITPD